MRILVLDNYDSFTYILVQYLGELGVDLDVVRNDAVTVDRVLGDPPGAILVSPGPGRPEDAGISVPLIAGTSGQVPILGVCLGHQAIVEAFGGRTVGAPRLMHGKSCQVLHSGSGLFQGIDSPATCMRYHSLIADPSSMPRELAVTAWTTEDHDEVMALEHISHQTFGVQFHPESIGTPDGMRLLSNFVEIASGRRPPNAGFDSGPVSD